MNMTEVESSQIHSIGYDQDSQRLHVRFKRGGLYEYHGVAPETHKAFMEAESKGSHFQKNIRNVHACKKLEEASS